MLWMVFTKTRGSVHHNLKFRVLVDTPIIRNFRPLGYSDRLLGTLDRFNPCSDGRVPTGKPTGPTPEDLDAGFNPCSDGRVPTGARSGSQGYACPLVSILVLMEESQRAVGAQTTICRSLLSFNPCSDGRVPTGWAMMRGHLTSCGSFNPCSDGRVPTGSRTVPPCRMVAEILTTSCFNPCSDGRVPTGRARTCRGRRSRVCFNPCSDGRVPTGRLFLNVFGITEQGFNPCSDGRVPTGSKGFPRPPGPHLVSILVLMEESQRGLSTVSTWDFRLSFNPCSDGRVPTGRQALPLFLCLRYCFNPCSDGRVPTGYDSRNLYRYLSRFQSLF